MNIASKSTATPNRVEMLLEFIKDTNKQYTKKELQELFSPQSDAVFKDNFSILNSLQLIKIEDDIVRINLEKSKLSTLEIIQKAIFDDDFVYKDNFVYSLAWLMIQDENSIQKLDWQGQVNTLIMDDLLGNFSELDLTSNPPWQNFYYWCNYLGFATKSYISKNTYVFPDPTEAIQRELSSIFGKNKELKIDNFFKLLAQKIPVLEYGSARNKIMENTREGLSIAKNQLSFATSLALLRLEKRGLIVLTQKSDATSMTIKTSTEDRIISHISYVGK